MWGQSTLYDAALFDGAIGHKSLYCRRDFDLASLRLNVLHSHDFYFTGRNPVWPPKWHFNDMRQIQGIFRTLREQTMNHSMI